MENFSENKQIKIHFKIVSIEYRPTNSPIS